MLLILGLVYVRRLSDPDVQWAAIGEVIAVDEPHPTFRIFGFPRMNGLRSWVMSNGPDENTAIILSDQEKRIRLFESWQDLPEVMAEGRMAERIDPTVPSESGTITVQGRDLRCLRFGLLGKKARTSEEVAGPPDARSHPAILLDLSNEGAEESLACMLFAKEGDRVEDAQVLAFLKPFHVGPDR
ncbi:MAG: hypothetical protein ACKVXR_17550 [Planctomycetota bacterium]